MKKRLQHEHKIHKLQVGTLGIDKGFMTYFHDYGTDLSNDFPIQFFYIEGPDENILVDTGGPAEENNKFWFGAKDIQSFEDALAKVNLKPEDIDIIICTHAMFDHMLNAQKCPNARVYIQEEELRFAYSPNPIIAGTYSKSYLRDLKFIPICGDQEIAPGVKAISLPGHSPGTQGVAVETKDGLAVITGFCCIEENFTECPEPFKDMWNNMIPIGIHTDPVLALESMNRVKGLADIIVPQHGMKIPEVIG
nr:N-acyl homoserine lactonase family protein [Desulfobacterales bacterium]